MGTTALVSVDDYLHTSFPDGDREYVDGELVERGMPTIAHGGLQAKLVSQLLVRRPDFFTGVAVRLQITSTRFRVPDVVVAPVARPEDQAIFEPPLLVVEIISPDDRVSDLDRKIDEYRAMGVPNIWIFDPEVRRVRTYTAEGIKEITDGDIRTIGGEISISLSEIFPISSR